MLFNSHFKLIFHSVSHLIQEKERQKPQKTEIYTVNLEKKVSVAKLEKKIVLHQITRTHTPKNYFTHNTQSINI